MIKQYDTDNKADNKSDKNQNIRIVLEDTIVLHGKQKKKSQQLSNLISQYTHCLPVTAITNSD